MDPADVVLRFLESVSAPSEIQFYLGLFRALPRERFAAISVDASVAGRASEAVVLDLRFLAALGLSPVVVFGLFDSAEAREHAARIQRRLSREGVPAALFEPDVPDLFDLVEQVGTAARSGVIPLVAFGRDVVPFENPDLRVARLGELLMGLATRKMIFLNQRGGLRVGGGPLAVANLTTDYDALVTARELSKKQRMLVAHSRRLVFDLVPHRLLVAITSPLDLLRELFTVRGAGTLLRRGAVIERHADMSLVDGERLRALLASSFGRPTGESFFERPLSHIYLEEGYRGAALLADTPIGSYLTKFAVEREAQGEGIGRDLWQRLAADHPTVFWRARPDNPIGSWYAKLCDGLARMGDWYVYWKGLAPGRIPEAIEFALAQPVDIAPRDATG